MYPNSNPLGGGFNVPENHYNFTFEGIPFYPSNIFMYSINLNPYFSIEELTNYLTASGYTIQAELLSKYKGETITIENVKYISRADLKKVNLSVGINWLMSSSTPVKFSIS